MFLSGSIDFKMAVHQSRKILGPPTSKSNKNTAITRNLMCANRQFIIREMDDELNLSVYKVQSILTEDLDIRQVSTKFIPELLADEQKEH